MKVYLLSLLRMNDNVKKTESLCQTFEIEKPLDEEYITIIRGVKGEKDGIAKISAQNLNKITSCDHDFKYVIYQKVWCLEKDIEKMKNELIENVKKEAEKRYTMALEQKIFFESNKILFTNI